jgi:hypothetical protein
MGSECAEGEGTQELNPTSLGAACILVDQQHPRSRRKDCANPCPTAESATPSNWILTSLIVMVLVFGSNVGSCGANLFG